MDFMNNSITHNLKQQYNSTKFLEETFLAYAKRVSSCLFTDLQDIMDIIIKMGIHKKSMWGKNCEGKKRRVF